MTEGRDPRGRRSPAARAVGAGLAALLFCGLAQPLPVSAAELDAAIGRALFRRAWTPAPSSTRANDGLGPLFNARACTACHQNLDRSPLRLARDGTVENEELLLRLSDDAGRPDPVYGSQLQTSSVPGVLPEGKARRRPDGRFEPTGLRYGPLAPTTRVGARTAPLVRGLGLLQAVPAEAVLARADPEDRDGDGVRGRPNWIRDEAGGAPRLGRFGWKAQADTIQRQTENAFASDMGLSGPVHPAPWADCTDAQPACKAAPHGGTIEEPEIGEDLMRRIAVFLASVPAPVPAGDKPPSPSTVQRGAALFERTGCATCHAPELPSPLGPVRAFTDLLLHDMGPELDGGATEPGVKPTEWRTAPLWGLSRALSAGAGLLHDGRARSVEDAVAAHGGEGAGARARFRALSAEDRRLLLDYLKSL